MVLVCCTVGLAVSISPSAAPTLSCQQRADREAIGLVNGYLLGKAEVGFPGLYQAEWLLNGKCR